jgi:hypothetical protein
VDASDLRLQAAKCRRLAKAIVSPDDPAIATLLALANEYEQRAGVFKTGTSASHVADVQKSDPSGQN